MSDKLIITKPNDVHIRIECDPHISQELSEYFTFEVPGARFMPAVRNKYWDGKIRLFNQMTRLILLVLNSTLLDLLKNVDMK